MVLIISLFQFIIKENEMILIDSVIAIEVLAVKSIWIILKLIFMPFKFIANIARNPMSMYKF